MDELRGYEMWIIQTPLTIESLSKSLKIPDHML